MVGSGVGPSQVVELPGEGGVLVGELEQPLVQHQHVLVHQLQGTHTHTQHHSGRRSTRIISPSPECHEPCRWTAGFLN